MHLANWETIKLSKDNGGWGIYDLTFANTAMMSKWLWNFGIDRRKLRRKIIADKFGEDKSGCFTTRKADTFGCSVWMNALEFLTDFKSQVKHRVGNGKQTAFWLDAWLFNKPIAAKFPALYRLASDPSETVDNQATRENGQTTWCIRTRQRRLPGRAATEAQQLHLVLSNTKLSDVDDDRKWGANNVEFTSKAVYRGIENHLVQTGTVGDINFPKPKIWNADNPLKVSIMIWMLYTNVLPTDARLRVLGFEFPSRCRFCECSEETNDHIFFFCDEITLIWKPFLIATTAAIPITKTWIIRTWDSLVVQQMSEIGRRRWSMFFPAFAWGVWVERCKRIFEGTKSSRTAIQQSILFNFWKIVSRDTEIRDMTWVRFQSQWHRSLF